MKVLVTTPADINLATEYTARKYAFPKKGNQPADYNITLDGVTVEARTTGGGKYPAYTYFMYEGVSYYLPKEAGALPTDSAILTIKAVTTAPTPDEIAEVMDKVEKTLAAEKSSKKRSKID